MKFHEWEIAFSIGVLTFLTMPLSADQMVSLTEALMYEAKSGRQACSAIFHLHLMKRN
jgi:hypothetical protein